MRVLVTNDDGVDAPGILALAEALAALGEVWIVAPEREQSAKSHAFTLHKPLRVTTLGERRLTLSGTPADCAYAGIHGLIPTPDLVVSGINRGANLGTDVHYSGTVAAAREACLQGVPAIAASLYIRADQPTHRYARAAKVVLAVARKLLDQGLPAQQFLNVNVPNGDVMQGTRATVLGRRRYSAEVERRTDPRGRDYVWIGGKPLDDEPIANSDVHWARLDWSTVTPLRLDPTAHDTLETLDGWL